jgi:hypothetical protein
MTVPERRSGADRRARVDDRAVDNDYVMYEAALVKALAAAGRREKVLRRFLIITAGCVIATAIAVAVLLWYVQEIRQVRDQQLRDVQEQIREGQCDLLDEFPEGGLLERPRAKYGCGPGYPASELDPEQRDEQPDIRIDPPAVDPPAPRLSVPDGPRSLDTKD